jgi:hypothetical protein
MTQDRQRQRNQLIRQALQDAVERVAAATDPANPDAAFAPIGELVFWIVAADQGLEKQYRGSYTKWRDKHQHGHLFPAIRYARNKVAHESEAWDYVMRDDVPTWRYHDSYGGVWVWVKLPPPGKARNKKDQQRWQRQFDAYNRHLRNNSVSDTAGDAVDVLRGWWAQQGI